MKKIINTAGILIIKEDSVLLIKHKEKASHLNGVYGLPAGRIDQGEDAMICAIRELEEETSLKTSKEYLIPLKKRVADIKRKSGEIVTMPYQVFLCTKFSGKENSSEEGELEWVKVSDLNNINLLPNVYEIVFEGLEIQNNS